jgi:hypothetical protein
MVSSKVRDFSEYNGWTNWATWNVNLWLDNDEQLHKLSKQMSSPELLQEFCEHFIHDFLDFWNEDRFGNKSLDEREWDNINWEELYDTYKEEDNGTQ